MWEFVGHRKAQDVNILEFTFNEINFDQEKRLKSELKKLLDSGEKKFIIDLSRIGFLSSLVITTIVFFAKEVKEKNGEVKLSGLSHEVLGVLHIAQLDKVCALYRTEHEALESFGIFGNGK